MRLGDLDALKIVIRDNPYLMENLNDDNFECILDLIDNAPTVKFSLMPADETKEDAYKRGYEKGKIAGILMANTRPQGEQIAWEQGYEFGKNEKRPQGKWIKNLDSCNDEMQASCYCSECGASCYCATDKFCHECGAKMGNIK